MATVEKPAEKATVDDDRRIVLYGISWELYEQLREKEENWTIA
ncbi:MAG TPA: hypothetical protein VF306_04960 [Pirellulales bacterium]